MERRTKENPDAQLVCLDGHLITSEYYGRPDDRVEHCPVDGKPTIHACPSCGAEIPGTYYWDSPILRSRASGRGPRGPNWSPVHPKQVPAYCSKCGQPYPWTESRIQTEEAAAAARQPDALDAVEWICSRFHLVARQLQQRHDKRDTLAITDEYDVQDLFHALLRLFFDDIRKEEWTPSYAGSATRMDFLLKGESLVVEVKRARQGLGHKELGKQLLEDIAHYKQHPDCKTLVCFVYDPDEWVSNPQGLMADLTKQTDGLNVQVLIVPRR